MIALIDGDVIAHVSCKNRFMNENGERVVRLDEGEYEFSKKEDEEYLEKCYKEFNWLLTSILDTTFADDYMMAVKGDDNYRDQIYCDYKANRVKDTKKRNHFVPVLRELAAFEGKAVTAHGREADDLLRIWAEQASAADVPYVIVTVDKDLDCIPGKHYNIKKNLFYDVTPLYATRFFYQQLMSGDPTDNIPGIPRIGPIKAEGFLKGVDDEAEMQEIVVGQYMTAFGEAWYDQLLSNGKMIHIQKSEHDFFSLDNWAVVQAVGRPMSKVVAEAHALCHSEAEIGQPSPDPQEAAEIAPAPKAVAPSPSLKPGMGLSPSPKPFTGMIPKKV